MLKGTSLLVVLFFALALIVYVLSTPTPLNPQTENDQEEKHNIPYAVAYQPVTRSYTNEGKLASQINAEKLEYFKSERSTLKQGELVTTDYSVVTQPQLTFFETNLPWKLSSNYGLIERASNLISFSGEVTLQQNYGTNRHTKLETSRLYVDVVKKNATTNERVKVSSRFGKIEATGMEVDFNQETVRLNSQVQGIHEPR